MTSFTSSLKLKPCMNLSEELKKICPLKLMCAEKTGGFNLVN